MSAIVKEVYDAFRSAGVSDAQATAAAQAIPLRGDLATKGDVGVLRSDIGVLRSDIDGLRAEVRAEISGVRAELKGDLKELELRIAVKFYAAVGLVVAGIKALDFLVG